MSSGHDKRQYSPAEAIDAPGAAPRLAPSDEGTGTDQPTGKEKIGEKGGRNKAPASGKDRDMGAALRSAYQETVEEAIPSDLLDLLGKLD